MSEIYEMTEYKSETISVQDIIENEIYFKIPIYQRLYVWKKEQIHALLSDISSTFRKTDTGEESIFYLGNVIVQEKNGGYELIDGQQRFTTLWLLSIYLQNHLKKYAFPNEANGNADENPLRIEFDIRDQVSEFMREIVKYFEGKDNADDLNLEHLINKDSTKSYETAALEPLANAFKEIKTFFSNYPDGGIDEERLSNYISQKVQLVMTVVPTGVDLNKLFEVLNNRGTQLEHHQILKANMLDYLNSGKRALRYEVDHYAMLWDSCSGMNEYVESAFQQASGKRITELDSYKKNKHGFELYKDSQLILTDLNALDNNTNGHSDKHSGISIEEVLNIDWDEITKPGDADKEVVNERSQEIKSIVNFPMFLQHTLRIYLKEKGRKDIERIYDKELIDSFRNHFFSYVGELESNEERANEVAAFVELLWDIRFVFDQYVIKWLKDEGTDVLKLCKVYEKPDNDKVYLYREAKGHKSDLSQLQRMLYHSQEMRTFYWLTPFLYFLYKYYNRLVDGQKDLEISYLKYLDNHLLNLYSPYSEEDSKPLIDRTVDFMDEIKRGEITGQALYNPDNQILDEPLGLRFPHYWFYKLEYLLWQQYNSPLLQIDNNDVKIKDFESFKITAKNSVEHIAPQNPRDKQGSSGITEDKQILNSFGNLALVSRSLNSSLSNSSYKLKREKFYESSKVRNRVESLKLLPVYKRDKEEWTKEDVETHKQQMITIFMEYLKSCEDEYKKLRILIN